MSLVVETIGTQKTLKNRAAKARGMAISLEVPFSFWKKIMSGMPLVLLRLVVVLPFCDWWCGVDVLTLHPVLYHENCSAPHVA